MSDYLKRIADQLAESAEQSVVGMRAVATAAGWDPDAIVQWTFAQEAEHAADVITCARRGFRNLAPPDPAAQAAIDAYRVKLEREMAEHKSESLGTRSDRE